RWESYLFKTRSHFDPVFALWNAYAALPRTEFASKAPLVREQWLSERDPDRQVNPLVLEAFSGLPPTSMREVAERYGKIFASVDQAWRQTLQAATTNKMEPPSGLDSRQEPIRQILYGPQSPSTVPDGAVI